MVVEGAEGRWVWGEERMVIGEGAEERRIGDDLTVEAEAAEVVVEDGDEVGWLLLALAALNDAVRSETVSKM